MKYYVDTCIWLNLFKKEGNPAKGIPYWRLARDFVENILMSSEDIIIYSDIVAREIQICLRGSALEKAMRFLTGTTKFVGVAVADADKAAARKLESKYCFDISFYDCVHISIAKHRGFVLVTRDEKLLCAARENGVAAGKPEEFTNKSFI